MVLPDDLVEEILSMLPVKDVLRCKLLSKAHHGLIKNPNFVSKHLTNTQSSNNNNYKSSKIVYASQDERVYVTDACIDDTMVSRFEVYVPPPPTSSLLFDIDLVGSCNGLLCGEWQSYEENSFLLWNPATKDDVVLPKHGLTGGHHTVGFGYDGVNKDYKLVMISVSSSRFLQAELWSMSTNIWREIEFVNSPPILKTAEGYFFKGNLYWLFHTMDFDQDFIGAILISFNLVNNTFQTHFTLPECGINSFIMDFKGSLAVSIAMPLNENGVRLFDIWMMDDDGKENSWKIRFSIGPFGKDVKMSRSMSRNGSFLMYKEYCKKEYFLYGDCRKEYFLYDPDTKWIQSIRLSHIPYKSTRWSFTESLVSVKAANLVNGVLETTIRDEYAEDIQNAR